MILTSGILKRSIFFLGVIIACILSSCSPEGISQINPENDCWEAKDALSFDITHEGGQFPLEIALLLTDDYTFSNLYLKLEITGPAEWKYEDLQTETFIDPLGNWQMDQKGNSFPYIFSAFSNLELPQQGTYHFRLTHQMRKDPLCGVKAVSANINSGQ